jgi:hypothetical protein
MSMPDTFREPFGLIVEDNSLYAHTVAAISAQARMPVRSGRQSR